MGLVLDLRLIIAEEKENTIFLSSLLLVVCVCGG
jgi:hypothetical protein